MIVKGMELCPGCMRPARGDCCPRCGGDLRRENPAFLLPAGALLRRADARDGWYLGAVLGQGGFGTTYIGLDQESGQRVAVKEYFPTRCAKRAGDGVTVEALPGMDGIYEGGRYSFVKEARVLSELEGMPSVVQALAYLETNNTAYLVMEYLDGTPLHRMVDPKTDRRVPPEKLLPPLKGLLYDIGLLHEKKVIHRDIAPDNIMWMPDGTLKLLDFGSARSMEDGKSMTVMLKHGFAPVEQYQSKGQGPWTDVYALSATIYYCLTGRKPPQAMDRLVEDELIPPRKLGVDLTQQQEKALLYGMGVPPRRRFQSMEEFHTALYEGFVPGAEGAGGGTGPAAAAGAADPDGADREEKTVETVGAEDKPAASFDLAAWLGRNKLLAGGAAAILTLVILLAAVLPRLPGPSSADGSALPTQQPGVDPGVDYLARFMETVEWLRLDDVEVDGTGLRAKLDALPIDELFAGAVHVTTLAELDRALEQADKPIVIDGDIDFSGDSSGSHRNNRVPVLISEGVTVSGAWENGGRYENVPKNADACWTVDGSILINRGTMRGTIHMGDWDNDGVTETNVLLNYGTMYSDLSAGHDYDSYNVAVNLGAMGISGTQYRQTSFYNLGTILHGTIVPEGETVLITTPPC